MANHPVDHRNAGTVAVQNLSPTAVLTASAPGAEAVQGHGDGIAHPGEKAPAASRVLIVDDEEVICEMIAQLVAALGCDPVRACCGEEAWSLFEAAPFPLVIADIVMPGLSGLELLSRVRERSAATQVIITTVYATLDHAVRALRGGAYDFQVKPFDLERMEISVRRALEKHALIRERDLLLEELSRTNRALSELANRDGLTRLYNHRYFQEELRREVARSRRNILEFSLIFLDIDGFKGFNDSLGHPEGDRILRELAALLGGELRGSDLVARYGGEEFVIPLPQTGKSAAVAIAEGLRRKVAERTVVTVSLGVASYPDDETEPEGLIDCADRRLYQAKSLGKNRVVA